LAANTNDVRTKDGARRDNPKNAPSENSRGEKIAGKSTGAASRAEPNESLSVWEENNSGGQKGYNSSKFEKKGKSRGKLPKRISKLL
jgi:hypothetical protein